MSAAPKLPPQLHVFVRDWLSSNNVLLKSGEGHVLIDSGYVRHAPLTMALLATPAGIGGDPLAKLVNTHCHSDHIGGNATIKNAQTTCRHCNASKGDRDYPVTPPADYQGPWPPPWWRP